MGDGIISIRRLRECADAAGFSGPIEIEIFIRALWDREPDEALNAICGAYLEGV